MTCRDPDEDLWRRAQSGDHGAFARLQERCRPLVFGEIRKRLYFADSDNADDIAQNVWIAVWKGLPRFHADSTFRTWLVGIIKNTTFDWLRASKRTEPLGEEHEECLRSESEPGEDEIVSRLTLKIALKKLPESERVVIVLSALMRLTDEEIADRTATPLGTVKSRKRAGLRRLRKLLGGDGESQE